MRAWGEEWLMQRERGGYRHVPDDRRRWSKHVAQHRLAHYPIRGVTEPMAREWLHDLLIVMKRGRPLAANTCRNALNLLRTAFTDACEDGLIDFNPFLNLRVPRARAARTDEMSTVLSHYEQRAFLAVIPEPQRWLVAFALGTGLRQHEQWALRQNDVHAYEADPHIYIGARRVPIFGMALEATRQQLRKTKRVATPGKAAIRGTPHPAGASESRVPFGDGYLWPAPRGGPRDKKAPPGWRDWLKAAGITRRVRWHDLRHTCAASLVSGWWGRAWSLEEVKELLGHSSISITERYAHFAKDVLINAARETVAPFALREHPLRAKPMRAHR